MLNFVRKTLDECRTSMKWAIQVVADVAIFATDKVIGAIIGH